MITTHHLQIAFLAATVAVWTASSSRTCAQAQAPAAPQAPAADKPVTEEKPPAWETSASLGLTLTRGNSKTLLATANVLSE